MDELETQDAAAKRYPRRYQGNGLEFHRYLIDEMVDGLDGSGLDVGCGIGIISDLHPELDLLGIDFSHEMIAANPHLCELGNAEELDFDDDTFDFVICRGVIHHLEHPDLGVAEIARVLKPGGRAIFLETNKNAVTALPRYLMRFTPWFSQQHKNFRIAELEALIADYFHLDYVGYRGYLAYALTGFPDIIHLPMPRGMARCLIQLDKRLAESKLAPLGFNSLIKATKR